MANPMNLFRRYQKIMLAVLGILCMLIFVVADPLVQWGSRNKVEDPIVVRSNFGNLRQSELAAMVQTRKRLNEFFQRAIANAGQVFAQQQRQFGERGAMIAMQRMYMAVSQSGLVAGTTDEDVVRSMLLKNNAQALGMSVSDRAIVDILRAVTMQQLSIDQLASLGAALGFSQRQLLDELRAAQLAVQFQNLMLGLNEYSGISPEQRWEYFQRVNRAISIEALPIAVEQFVSQVPTPDEDQLLALYEQHKHDDPRQGSPTAGFHRPVQAKFAYFKARLDDFLDKVKVAPAEIYDKYEQERDAVYRLSTPSTLSGVGPDGLPLAPEAPAAESPAAEGPAAGAAPESPAQAPEGSANEAPSSSETPAASTDAAPAPPTPAPTPSEPAAPAPSPGEPGPGSGGDDPPTQPADASATPAEGTSAPTETTAPGDSAAQPAGDAAADATPSASAEAPAPAPEDELTFKSWEDFVMPASVDEPRYRPLSAVYDEVRRQVASQRVDKQIDEAFGPLRDIIEDYARELDDYTTQREKNPALKPPQPLDLAALAKEHGVTAHETELLSRYDAAETTDLGKSFVPSDRSQEPFVDVAFTDLLLYTARRSVDGDGNRYLFWKTEHIKEQTPSFAEAREAVLTAYKTIEARKLAVKQAETLAAEARKSDKNLKEVFADRAAQVVDVANFTWLTEGAVPAMQFGGAPLEISQLPGIDAPGDRFMAAVYALEPGQVTATMNAPETFAYVVRMTGQQYSDDLLRTRFMAATLETYLQAGASNQQKFEDEWFKNLETSAGLTWVRPADQQDRPENKDDS
ncbi:MAG: hypothetical protein K2Y37_09920 [Pirellulales bacterium]|nr:hypothetical protein [Pirellulales bacterium]